jgi:hypothetical protein
MVAIAGQRGARSVGRVSSSQHGRSVTDCRAVRRRAPRTPVVASL